MPRLVFDMKKVIVVLGQTATGKSDLAVKIAKKFHGEVVSADSRQVYKGLDLGTGKITQKEMKGVPHHLLDVASPKKVFTVAQFQKLANKKIKGILKRGRLPIICGGTGFYIDSVTKALALPEVPPNKKLRQDLEKKESSELFKILKKLDVKRAKDIQAKNELNNKVRLIRAIEIAKALGKIPKIIEGSPRYKFIKVGVELPKEELDQKIEKRVRKMFKQGLLEEIKKLKKSGISEKRLKELGFEYHNPTIESVILGTRQYAKRQRTWFKRDPEVHWFHPKDQTLLPFIASKIKGTIDKKTTMAIKIVR